MNTSMPPSSWSPSQGPGRGQRRWRNWIIDRPFQLKYVALIVFLTIAVSSVLAGFLWRVSSDVVRESERVAIEGRRVVAESRKVSDVIRMSMKQDQAYAQDPTLSSEFERAAADADRQLELQAMALDEQQKSIALGQSRMRFAVTMGLMLIVVIVAMLSVYFTHKVAGPAYKMKKLIRQVADGRLIVDSSLRKGDELWDLFKEFARMIEKLRARNSSVVEQLNMAILAAEEAGADPSALDHVRVARDRVRESLD